MDGSRLERVGSGSASRTIENSCLSDNGGNSIDTGTDTDIDLEINRKKKKVNYLNIDTYKLRIFLRHAMK